MITGAPGSLKTTVVSKLEIYPDFLPLTDVNVQQLALMRPAMCSGEINTLGLLDYQKLYERNPQTAQNIEGLIRALADDGVQAVGFEDSRVHRAIARATIIAALTDDLLGRMHAHWVASGFERRFLWVSLQVGSIEQERLLRAVEANRLIDTGGLDVVKIPVEGVPYIVQKEARIVRALCKPRYGHQTPFQTLCKIASVLKWKYKRWNKVEDILAEFAPALGKRGTELTL